MLVTATLVTLNLGINMNIELEEVVVQDVSDDALERAAGGAQGAWSQQTAWIGQQHAHAPQTAQGCAIGC